MLTDSTPVPKVSAPARTAVPGMSASLAPGEQRWALALLTRLHFYIGLLVGPFLFTAALSGILYALTPQIEDRVYRHELYTDSTGNPAPLQDQIAAARKVTDDAAALVAVRPAHAPGATTRIMFTEQGMGPSESRAIFIDPVTAEVRGDLGVYGTSGVLPIRAWIDLFHRGLHLGDAGRLYSELAASWLWIAAIGGLALWVLKYRRLRSARSVSAAPPLRRHRLRDWHGRLGLWVLIGVLFFSVTGLTWSQWAGGNISVLRAYYGWGTPSVATSLDSTPGGSAADEHAHHHHVAAAPPGVDDAAMFDSVLAAARMAGIDAGKVEIRPPSKPGKAWTVTEIDRSWPTQVDAVAIDPRNMAIVDQIRFVDFPLAAKLTRWGIDAHMGALFGLANQLVLIFFAGGLLTMIIWGYIMWWRRLPSTGGAARGHEGLLSLLGKAPVPARVAILIAAGLTGWFLPVLGFSLVLFVLVDGILLVVSRRRNGPRLS